MFFSVIWDFLSFCHLPVWRYFSHKHHDFSQMWCSNVQWAAIGSQPTPQSSLQISITLHIPPSPSAPWALDAPMFFYSVLRLWEFQPPEFWKSCPPHLPGKSCLAFKSLLKDTSSRKSVLTSHILNHLSSLVPPLMFLACQLQLCYTYFPDCKCCQPEERVGDTLCETTEVSQ